uniref:Cyp450 n=1 Tax=Hordeum vulgare TaxID=4513 RepID=A0A060RLT0_HORVU|nr:cyp450 [Hordeum vulgare]
MTPQLQRSTPKASTTPKPKRSKSKASEESMATPDDCAASWLLYLSLAAKCGGDHPGRLAGLLSVCAAAFAVTCILHWCFPGGAAWGRWWLTRRLKGSLLPGPRGLPLIGSMWLMTGLAHRKLAAEAARLGGRAKRLMAFSLGETRMVVAAHPDVAREILNSPAFADRPIKESAYGLLFHRAIGFAPHGAYWRALRRVASTHLFSPWQITASAPQRAVIASQMVSALVGAGAGVEVRRVLRRASLHNVMWSVFGRRYDLDSNKESEEVRELSHLVDEGYDLLGQLNWSDHLPWLARFDLQGTRARCSGLVPRVNRFVRRIIDDHRSAAASAGVKDFTDVLLSLQGGDKLADADMIAVLWEMVFRGTDTVAVLMEWVLARLVLHRDVQARVHEEPAALMGPPRHLGRARGRLPHPRWHHGHGEHVGHNPRPRRVGRAGRVPPGAVRRRTAGGRALRDGVGPPPGAVRGRAEELPREEPGNGDGGVLAGDAAARAGVPAVPGPDGRRQPGGDPEAVVRDGGPAGRDAEAATPGGVMTHRAYVR